MLYYHGVLFGIIVSGAKKERGAHPSWMSSMIDSRHHDVRVIILLIICTSRTYTNIDIVWVFVTSCTFLFDFNGDMGGLSLFRCIGVSACL